MLLEGIFPPLTTCFYADGRLHWRKLEQNVEHYSLTPVSGFTLLGSAGEAAMLSDEESREVLRTARDAAAPEKVLLAGVGCESVLETLHLAEHAAKLDYDAVLVRTPCFYRPQMRLLEMLTYYQTVADRSPLPVVLSSVPAYTGYELPVEAVAELAMHPNIIAMKDSGGSAERVTKIVEATRGIPTRTVAVTPFFAAVTARMRAAPNQAGDEGGSFLVLGRGSGAMASPVELAARPLRTRTKQVGFQLLTGETRSFYAALQAGAAGGVLALANFAPQAAQEIYTAWKDNDASLAKEKQQRVVTADEEICARMGIPGIKHAQDLNGYYGGRARMPLLPLTGEEQRRVEALLRDLRN